MRKVTYTTASGDAAPGTTFDLSSAKAIGWGNDLLGWSWDADKDTGAITRAARTYELMVVAIDVATFDELSRRMEQDAVSGRMGTLSVDGWKLSCAAKTAAPKHVGDGIVSAKLTLYATDPTWRRVTSHTLVPESGTQTETTGLDYPTDYGYDYAGTTRSSGIESFSLAVESSIRITFYGPCTNPYCTVTSRSGATSVSNRFGVNASAETGERIVIDPLGRHTVGSSVYKVGAFGERTNLFDARVRGTEGSGSYVFATMPAGSLSVAWPQEFGVTLDTIEERGSLPWN